MLLMNPLLLPLVNSTAAAFVFLGCRVKSRRQSTTRLLSLKEEEEVKKKEVNCHIGRSPPFPPSGWLDKLILLQLSLWRHLYPIGSVSRAQRWKQLKQSNRPHQTDDIFLPHRVYALFPQCRCSSGLKISESVLVCFVFVYVSCTC